MQTKKTGGDVPSPPDPPAFLDVRALRLLLVLYALTISLPGLFSLPPGDRDESRFAQATKQMTETGNYVQIMNGTEARNKKPIGIYWLQAPFVLAAGSNLANPIWPYRIPSVLGGIAAVLATFETGLLFWRSPAIGALAGAMLAASVILATETHIAKTDAALLGATTIAMAVLARAWVGAPIRRWQAALFWLALAAGILLKGPVTPMVVGLTALAASVGVRRAAWLRALKPAWGTPLLLAAVLPWFVAIGIATHGQFFAEAVGGDLGRKLAGGAESHGGFPGLHLLLLPLLSFPATLPVLRALPAAWADRRAAANTFLLAWIIPAWIVFEAVPTKLPHYTLPLYPALFLLAASSVLAPNMPAPAAWMRALSRAALVVAALILAGGAVALPLYLNQATWIGLPALAACVLVATLAWKRQIVWALATVPMLYAAILRLELPSLTPLWIAPRVETLLHAEWPGRNPLGRGLAVAGYAEPSLMFVAGTDVTDLSGGAEAANALARGSASAVLLPDTDAGAFAQQAARLGMSPRKRGEVRGFNYSRGRWVSLSLYTK
jgi:4-amino-4-deoxy-L-arabinose transferase-like glycosyltransferase